jgi:hypothetical protein
MSQVCASSVLLLMTVGNEKYKVEVASLTITFIQNFMKIGQLVQKLDRGNTHMHALLPVLIKCS